MLFNNIQFSIFNAYPEFSDIPERTQYNCDSRWFRLSDSLSALWELISVVGVNTQQRRLKFNHAFGRCGWYMHTYAAHYRSSISTTDQDLISIAFSRRCGYMHKNAAHYRPSIPTTEQDLISVAW